MQKQATNWRCKFLEACPNSTASRWITYGHNTGGLTDSLITDYITIIFSYGHFPHSCDGFSLLDFTCSQQLHHRQSHSDKWWSLQGVQTAAQLEHCKTPNHLSKEMRLSVSLVRRCACRLIRCPKKLLELPGAHNLILMHHVHWGSVWAHSWALLEAHLSGSYLSNSECAIPGTRAPNPGWMCMPYFSLLTKGGIISFQGWMTPSLSELMAGLQFPGLRSFHMGHTISVVDSYLARHNHKAQPSCTHSWSGRWLG